MANRAMALMEAHELAGRVQHALTNGVYSDSGEARARSLAFKTRLRALLAEYEMAEPAPPEDED